MKNILDELKHRIASKEEGYIKLDKYDFEKMYDEIVQLMGNDALVMLSENIAIVCFERYSYIKIYLYNKVFLHIEDFAFMKGARVIGENKSSRVVPIKLFLQDIIRLWWKIILILGLYILLYTSINADSQSLKAFVEVLITVCSIFIGTVFVFIGMFYGDKERSIILYRKGKCDSEFFTDKYVISLSIISLFMLLVAYSICDIQILNINNRTIHWILCEVNIITEYQMSMILTGTAILLLVICFDSLTNYYLRTCRNEFFVEAVNKEMDERRKNRLSIKNRDLYN